jgi:hypothetical protein
MLEVFAFPGRALHSLVPHRRNFAATLLLEKGALALNFVAEMTYFARHLTCREAPEFFTFGLLEAWDLPGGPVNAAAPTSTVRGLLRALRHS